MKSLTLLLFICSNFAFSQVAITKKSTKYYKEKTEILDKKDITYKYSNTFTINDSITAKVFKSEELIKVENSVKKEDSKFQAKLYIENGKLNYIKFIEISPRFKETFKISEFTVTDGKISFVNTNFKVGINLPPMQMTEKEISRNFGFNPNYNVNYIADYLNVLCKKLSINKSNY